MTYWLPWNLNRKKVEVFVTGPTIQTKGKLTNVNKTEWADLHSTCMQQAYDRPIT